jgi:hypothetical protein
VAEGVELGLQLCKRLRRSLPFQVERFSFWYRALDLAAGLGVIGAQVLGGDAQALHGAGGHEQPGVVVDHVEDLGVLAAASW